MCSDDDPAVLVINEVMGEFVAELFRSIDSVTANQCVFAEIPRINIEYN